MWNQSHLEKLKIILFKFSVAAEEDEVEDETVVEDEEVAEGKHCLKSAICLQILRAHC